MKKTDSTTKARASRRAAPPCSVLPRHQAAYILPAWQAFFAKAADYNLGKHPMIRKMSKAWLDYAAPALLDTPNKGVTGAGGVP
jgi:hypothetical protein